MAFATMGATKVFGSGTARIRVSAKIAKGTLRTDAREARIAQTVAIVPGQGLSTEWCSRGFLVITFSITA